MAISDFMVATSDDPVRGAIDHAFKRYVQARGIEDTLSYAFSDDDMEGLQKELLKMQIAQIKHQLPSSAMYQAADIGMQEIGIAGVATNAILSGKKPNAYKPKTVTAPKPSSIADKLWGMFRNPLKSGKVGVGIPYILTSPTKGAASGARSIAGKFFR